MANLPLLFKGPYPNIKLRVVDSAYNATRGFDHFLSRFLLKWICFGFIKMLIINCLHEWWIYLDIFFIFQET